MTQPVAPFPFGYTVEVERGTRNEFGDITYAVHHTIEGCGDAPRYSDENNENRTSVIIGRTLYGPYGADLQADDRVVLPNKPRMAVLPRKQRTFRVIGEVGQWASPFTGWTPGFEAALERVA